MTRLACPRCTYPIFARIERGVEVDHCHRCQGSFLDAGEAPQRWGEETCPSNWKQLWVAREARPSKLHCPKDGQRMEAHSVAIEHHHVVVDVCPRCQGMWLDRGEGATLRAIVLRASERQEEALAGQTNYGVAGYLFQLFTSLPLEVWNPVRRPPWLVLLLCTLLTLFFFCDWLVPDLDGTSQGLMMLVPREVLAGEHPWTLVTHAFLHSTVPHLLGNLYFLWVFGDNVEDRLGRRGFAALYIAALLGGGVAHLLSHPESPIPLLGASGAVAGLMGAYLVLFPRVQLWVVVVILRFRIPVYWYLGLWLLMQGLMQAWGVPGTAWVAHLGGFAVGAATPLLLRLLRPEWKSRDGNLPSAD